MLVTQCNENDASEWLALRRQLWPGSTAEAHKADMDAIHARGQNAFVGLLRADDSSAIGFIEACLRHDYVNGCETSPVAFIEGVFVHDEWRHRGGAALLFRAAEDWAIQQGCLELASDADIANTASHQAHQALGFTETERVVYFRKVISPTLSA